MENLKRVKDVFDKVGVTFWLDSGALLGAVRNGKLIGWDMDVDLGAWYDSINKIISAFPMFKESGFQVSLRRRYGFVVFTKGDMDIDVSLFRRTSNYAWKLSRANSNIETLLSGCIYALGVDTYWNPEGRRFIRKSARALGALPLKLRRFMTDVTWVIMDRCNCIIPWVIPKYYFEKLSTIQFYGIKFSIPSNAEKYLEYRYGCNWKTPNKNWRVRDDGAINWNLARVLGII